MTLEIRGRQPLARLRPSVAWSRLACALWLFSSVALTAATPPPADVRSVSALITSPAPGEVGTDRTSAATAPDADTASAPAAPAASEGGLVLPPQAAQEPPPYTLPAQGPGFHRSRGLHCDVLEHLKTPRTYRRLDSYMRPSAFWPRDEKTVAGRDYITGDWAGVRNQWYDKGIEIYGCGGFDYGRDLKSNLSDNPNIVPPGRRTYHDQRNYTQVYGLDIYSRIFGRKWQGGQLHASFTWPQTRPLYAYRNRLNPTGTSQIHGHFYSDVGVGDPTDQDQGARLFELWFQQTYGPGGRNYVRFGNIFPVIQIARSLVSDMFNFWTFTEPCVLGTTYFTGNAPCYPQAPLGVQVYHILNTHWELSAQAQQGYYGSTGRNNRRGVNWGIKASDGVETMIEVTRKGGTYSLSPTDHGNPWFIKIGGQFHTGPINSVYLDVNGNQAAITDVLGVPRLRLRGNGQLYAIYERMLYREPGSYGQGLTLFAKAGGGFWDDRNVVRRWYASGIGYEGLLPRRDRDVLYAGWSMVRTTDGFVTFQTLNEPCALVPGCEITGRQDVWESGYNMEFTPWLHFGPMVQYLRHPNTRTDLGDLITAGVTSRVSF